MPERVSAYYVTMAVKYYFDRKENQINSKVKDVKRYLMQKRYILFLIPFILYIGLLGVLPQMEPDEARYSLIPSAMNQSGNYVTPQLKHIIYLEKPPLVYWATALSFKIFGENDFSARLFVGLCAWGCILLAYFIGKNIRDEKTGLYAAMLLTISTFPFVLGRINILDTPLTFFVCLSIWLGYLAVQKQKKYLFYLFYLACALGFLTKGIIGVVFPFGILIIWLIWAGRWRQIWKLFSPIGILLFLIVVCPWLIMAQKENPDFLVVFLCPRAFPAFHHKNARQDRAFYFYLPILVGGLIPWLFYLIKAWKNKYIKESLFSKDENKLLIVWFLLIFIFYSVSSSKLATYIAPVFLPIALFAGCIFKKYEEEMPVEQNTWQKDNLSSGNYFPVFNIIYRLDSSANLKKYSDAEKGLVVMVSDRWWLYIIIPVIVLFLLTFLPDLIYKKIQDGLVFQYIYSLRNIAGQYAFSR